MMQGRLPGGTSAVNAIATLRGQPADYDAWADAGLEGWGWYGAAVSTARPDDAGSDACSAR